MSSTDVGSQIISFDYKEEALGKTFNNLLNKVVPTGIYSGGLLTRYGEGVVTVAPMVCYIRSSTSADNLSLRVEFTQAFNITVTSDTPYIAIFFNWSNVTNNYADVVAVSQANIGADYIVLGKAIYSGTDILTSFDYSRRTISSIADMQDNIVRNALKVKTTTTASSSVLIDGGVEILIGSRPFTIASQTVAITSVGISVTRTDLVYLSSIGVLSVLEGVSDETALRSYGGVYLAKIVRTGARSVVDGHEIFNKNLALISQTGAGSGLIVNSTTNMTDINVDDSTLAVSGDVLIIKDSGVTDTKIGSRTIIPATPSSSGDNTGTLLTLLNKLAGAIGVSIGTNWYSPSERASVNGGNVTSWVQSGCTGGGLVPHAEGSATVASGDYSHTEGTATTASGGNSHAENYYTQASGSPSHAEGSSTIASGNGSHAEGYGTTASGLNAHTEGYGTAANGNNAHAEGYSTIASANNSHAEGTTTTASGVNAHAEGVSTIASGIASHAEGWNCSAPGNGSHAMGSGALSIGDSSFAQASGFINVVGDSQYRRMMFNVTPTWSLTGSNNYVQASIIIPFSLLTSGVVSFSISFRSLFIGYYSGLSSTYPTYITEVSAQSFMPYVTSYTYLDSVGTTFSNSALIGPGFFRERNTNDTYTQVSATDIVAVSNGVSSYIASAVYSTSSVTLLYKVLINNNLAVFPTPYTLSSTYGIIEAEILEIRKNI